MTLKDLFVTGAVAGVTMLGALALIAPTEVNASFADTPTVTVDGVEVSVRTLKAKRRPTAELTLHNTTNEAVVMRGTLRLYETSLANVGGRMAQPSIERWDKDCLYVLNAGEKKTVKLRAKKKLRKRTMGQFVLAIDSNESPQELYSRSFVPKASKREQVATLFRGLGLKG